MGNFFQEQAEIIFSSISGIVAGLFGWIIGKRRSNADTISVEVDTLIKTIKNHEDSIVFQSKQLEELRKDLQNCHKEMKEIVDEKLSNFEETFKKPQSKRR